MGDIRALPPAISGAASALRKLAADLDAVRGGFGAAATGAGGCDPQAAGAFEAMQRAWQTELARLGDVVSGVSGALQVAANDYVATDTSAVPAAAPGGTASGDPLTQLLLGGTGAGP